MRPRGGVGRGIGGVGKKEEKEIGSRAILGFYSLLLRKEIERLLLKYPIPVPLFHGEQILK